MDDSLKGLKLLSALSVLAVTNLAAANGNAGDARVASAARSSDRTAVASLLKARNDVNAALPDGSTALAWAAHHNDLEMADRLIAAGATANTANEYGISPLWLACTNANSDMVGKLLKARADVNQSQWSGATALMMCARSGDAAAVRALIAGGAKVDSAENKQGQTALMWAAAKGRAEVVRALVEAGADVNAATKGGTTAVMFAAQQGDVESGRLLVAAGANVNAVTNEQATWVGDTPLLLAAAGGHEPMAVFLLEKGANASAADEFGFTSLHFSMMKSLVQISGARVGLPGDLYWSTYLFRASMPKLVRALLAHGADPNARITKTMGANKLFSSRLGDPRKHSVYDVGATPFLLAAHGRDIEIMRMLKEAGADPLLATDGQTTPLMIAAGLIRTRDFAALPYSPEDAKKALDAVNLCIEYGADVNATNNVGLTALHAAAFVGLDDVIRTLVRKGAKIDAKDAAGQTPLHKAMNIKPKVGLSTMKNGHSIFVPYSYQKSTAELLLKLGAKPVA